MPENPSQPFGAASAIAAYLVLWVGMIVIGASAQTSSIVAGLWVTEVLAIALPATFALLVAGVRFGPYLGFRRISLKQAGIAIAVAAANQPVVSFLTWAAREIAPAAWVLDFDRKQRFLDATFAGIAVPMTITVVIAAPLGEELFFRGFAFPALKRSWGMFPALLVSSAAFSALHVDKIGFLGLMEIGIMLAALRWWSGSLWAAIIGHAVNNGIAGGAFILKLEDPDVPPPAWVLALGAALLMVGSIALVRVLRRPSPAEAVGERRPPNRALAGVLAVIWIAAVVVGWRSLPPLA